MYAMKWRADNGAEMIYSGRDISLTPRDDTEKRKASVTFYSDTGEFTSIDNGEVYVMNDAGKTIANYGLSWMNHPLSDGGQTPSKFVSLSDAQVKHMVNRFLGWKLPENFAPDGGISFKATFNDHTAHPMKHEPSGTNLFHAGQAEAMVRYMLEGLPA